MQSDILMAQNNKEDKIYLVNMAPWYHPGAVFSPLQGYGAQIQTKQNLQNVSLSSAGLYDIVNYPLISMKCFAISLFIVIQKARLTLKTVWLLP